MGQFLLYHYYTSFSGFFSLLISVAAIVYCIVQWSILTSQGKVALILIGLMFTVAQPAMILLRGASQMKSSDFEDSYAYIFNDAGINISQGEKSQQFTWESVEKIVCKKNAIYVYMSKVQAFVLPREQCEPDFDKLVAYMKEKKKK